MKIKGSVRELVHCLTFRMAMPSDLVLIMICKIFHTYYNGDICHKATALLKFSSRAKGKWLRFPGVQSMQKVVVSDVAGARLCQVKGIRGTRPRGGHLAAHPAPWSYSGPLYV